MKNKKDIIRIIAMVLCALLLFGILVMFTGCSEADMESPSSHTTKQIIIYRPDGEKIIEGEIESLTTYSSGKVIVRVNGVKYITHLANVLFIEEGD